MKKGKAFFIIFDGSPFSYNGLEKKIQNIVLQNQVTT
jgi:hypothetical protein